MKLLKSLSLAILRVMQVWLSAQLGSFAAGQFHFIAYNSWRYVLSSYTLNWQNWLLDLLNPRTIEYQVTFFQASEAVPCVAAGFCLLLVACKLALVMRRWNLLSALVFILFFLSHYWWIDSWAVMGDSRMFEHFFD